MQKISRTHEPRSGRGKPYEYEEILAFHNEREAWGFFNIGVGDRRAQLAFLAKEATRRNRERANANVNAPNAPKAPEVKLLNNAVRIVGVKEKIASAAKAGDPEAIRQVAERYREVLSTLEEALAAS